MILFLTGDSPDLAPDLLFNGLVELLGQDVIIDYPFAEYRHRRLYQPHNIVGRDYFCITTDKDVENRNKYNLDQINRLIDNEIFDLCIVANRAMNTFVKLNITKFPNVVMISGEDDSDSGLSQATNTLSNNKYYEHVDLILQRDYKFNKNYDDKVIPYNFSCPTNILPEFDFNKDKEIDVFAQFPPTHQFRSKVIEKLKKIKGINTKIKSQAIGYGGFGLYDYFKHMNNSKISVSITGAGWDTPHYLEIPFMKSMLLAQHPTNAMDNATDNAMDSNMKENPVIYLNNFTPGYSAQFYDTGLNNLDQLIRYYLDNDKEREQITKRGYEHLTKKLTTKNAAEYLFKCLNDREYWKTFV